MRSAAGGFLMRAKLALGLLAASNAIFVAGLRVSARQAPTPDPPIELFFAAASADAKQADAALAALGRGWRDGYTHLLVDLARFMVSAPRPAEDPFDRVQPLPDDLERRFGVLAAEPGPSSPRPTPARARLIRFLEARTGQRFGNDLDKWREWMWKLPYAPHADAMGFKAALYGRVDPRMSRFFSGRSLIRLDEIDWGGVKVNGIPPLVAPAAIPASRAGYLNERHVVFGVVAGGEARAYPKRILAWHEMARDTLGRVPLTIVYCTLCGTVIPYRSEVAGTLRTFGTSGLLYRSNKLMFDEETGSLWSTLEGRPVVGPLAGGAARLEFLPVVTTTWGEWRKTHPGTTVLSLETGFDRDYSEGAAYRDYFATDRLMFRVPAIDKRLPTKAEVLGLLLPAWGGGRTAIAFSAEYLLRHPIHHADFEGRRLVVLTSPRGANRIYDAGGETFSSWRGEDAVIDNQGRAWRVTESALVPSGAGPGLARIPAFRAFWFGWFAQFPDTELVR